MNTAEKVILGGASALIIFRLIDAAKSKEFEELFSEYADRYNVERALIKALARKESNFNPDAIGVNSNGTRDYGLLQVNERTFSHYGITDRFTNPSVNIETASHLLSDVKNELGDKYSIFTLISAYNTGSPNVLKHGITNPQYVGEVYLYYTLYKIS